MIHLKKIIFSSTAGVYGDVNSKNLKETDNLKPINPYAISKSKIEDFLVESSQTKNIYYTIVTKICSNTSKFHSQKNQNRL